MMKATRIPTTPTATNWLWTPSLSLSRQDAISAWVMTAGSKVLVQAAQSQASPGTYLTTSSKLLSIVSITRSLYTKVKEPIKRKMIIKKSIEKKYTRSRLLDSGAEAHAPQMPN